MVWLKSAFALILINLENQIKKYATTGKSTARNVHEYFVPRNMLKYKTNPIVTRLKIVTYKIKCSAYSQHSAERHVTTLCIFLVLINLCHGIIGPKHDSSIEFLVLKRKVLKAFSKGYLLIPM